MTSDSWYYDPDFFIRTPGGSYEFRAVDGKYDISADFNRQCFRVIPLDADGTPLSYHADDATGCIWVIGANSSYGKPTYEPGQGDGWSESRALPMARTDATHHQITFEVGQQLNPDHVNFKFFRQNSFGQGDDDAFTPFTVPSLTTISDIFYVNYNTPDCGNVKLRSGKKLTDGDVYVFTIDSSDPQHLILSTANLTDGIYEKSQTRTVGSVHYYDLSGRPVTRMGSSHQPSRRILIRSGKKIIQ